MFEEFLISSFELLFGYSNFMQRRMVFVKKYDAGLE